ncbi:HAMP domain-containing protein [Puia sp. P3]|uniref:HAMP domain-containing protein n=1 Tax=Puia sp. P3 TaxID=3423952 RepID=UPI003D66C88B
MKIQLKITLLFTGLCLAVIILLSTAVWYFANEKAFEDFYTRLTLRAVVASRANFDASDQNQQVYETLRREHLQRLPEEEEYIIRTDTLDRIRSTPLYETIGASFFDDVRQNGKASGRHKFQFYAGIIHKAPQGEYLIIITAVHSYAQHFLADLKNILTTGGIISVLVLITIGLLFSRQVLYPIRNIARRVNTISITSLHERLDVKGKDEVSVLATTFNDMLSRLETAFETQNNFVSNASHELNTPSRRSSARPTSPSPGNAHPKNTSAALAIIMAEAEKLRSITRGLLELAQSSFHGNLVYEPVDVDELVYNSLGVAHNVYPQAEIRLDKSLHPRCRPTHRCGPQTHSPRKCPALRTRDLQYPPQRMQVQLGQSHHLRNRRQQHKHHFYHHRPRHRHPRRPDQTRLRPLLPRLQRQKNTRLRHRPPLAQNIIRLYKGSITVSSKENVGTEVIVKFPL